MVPYGPKISDLFYIVGYNIKLGTSSWTHSTCKEKSEIRSVQVTWLDRQQLQILNYIETCATLSALPSNLTAIIQFFTTRTYTCDKLSIGER